MDLLDMEKVRIEVEDLTNKILAIVDGHETAIVCGVLDGLSQRLYENDQKGNSTVKVFND